MKKSLAISPLFICLISFISAFETSFNFASVKSAVFDMDSTIKFYVISFIGLFIGIYLLLVYYAKLSKMWSGILAVALSAVFIVLSEFLPFEFGNVIDWLGWNSGIASDIWWILILVGVVIFIFIIGLSKILMGVGGILILFGIFGSSNTGLSFIVGGLFLILGFLLYFKSRHTNPNKFYNKKIGSVKGMAGATKGFVKRRLQAQKDAMHARKERYNAWKERKKKKEITIEVAN